MVWSIVFYALTREALFKNVFNELKWKTEKITRFLEEEFDKESSDLLIVARNTVFKKYFTEPQKRDLWVKEIEKLLVQVGKLFAHPGYLDKSCFVLRGGQEICEVVEGGLKERKHPSPVSIYPFFKKTFTLKEGKVFQGKPYISEDTHRWVIPHATPLEVKGENVALLYFEVRLSYYQHLLEHLIGPERDTVFILNDKGEYILHTGMEITERKPLPKATSLDGPPSFRAVIKKMMNGGRGLERFSLEGKEYFIFTLPVRPKTPYNENLWTVGVMIPSERVYVEASILKYSMVIVMFTLLTVVFLSFIIGMWVTEPIKSLARGAQALASGDLSHRVRVKNKDELGWLATAFNEMAEAIRKRDVKLKTLASTDSLTGVYNRRYLEEELQKEIKRAKRYNHCFSLIMADIDNFKHYNDTHGHLQGDRVLKEIAKVIRRNSREIDLVARYGGEEFVIVLPETGKKETLEVAERIRVAIEKYPFPLQKTQPGGRITVSMGVVTFPEDGEERGALLEKLDRRLYMAKRKGKNQVFAG